MKDTNILLNERDLFNERDKIIKDIVKPIFKKAGFKVSGNTFRRGTVDLYQRLTIQNSSWNHTESVSFYINIDSESKYYYKFTGEELPINEPTWNFRSHAIIGGNQSYRLDYNISFEEFSKKIEEDMHLLLKNYFDLSSLNLYLMYIDLFKNHNSYGISMSLMYLLIPLLKENSVEGKKMFNNFLYEIQKSSNDSDDREKAKKMVNRCIDIIDNNKTITPPNKEKYYILNLGGILKNSLKKRKFKDVFPLVENWLKKNTYYEVDKEIKFILNRYSDCPGSSYTKEVELIVNNFMKKHFPHIDYEVGNEKDIFMTMHDVNKLYSLSIHKDNKNFFKFSKYEIELNINFKLKGVKEIDGKIIKNLPFKTNMNLKLSEYSDSRYYINFKEVNSVNINKNDMEIFMETFDKDFPYKISEEDFSIYTLELDNY